MHALTLPSASVASPTSAGLRGAGLSCAARHARLTARSRGPRLARVSTRNRQISERQHGCVSRTITNTGAASAKRYSGAPKRAGRCAHCQQQPGRIAANVRAGLGRGPAQPGRAGVLHCWSAGAERVLPLWGFAPMPVTMRYQPPRAFQSKPQYWLVADRAFRPFPCV
jgi:hypothetical protein